jgi:plasmid stabilization system protein ParE
MTRLEWTDPAVTDLENIQDYLARDSPEYADSVVERLIFLVERLRSFPHSGRVVPEASDLKVRELIVSTHRIMYRLRKDKVQILAVVHSARNLGGVAPEPRDAA